MNLETYLYQKCSNIIKSWEATDIYALSFLVCTNQNGNMRNFPEFSIGYNSESSCESGEKHSEERWNFAFWEQNNIPIISTEDKDSIFPLLKWYEKNSILDIGYPEDDETAYDEEMNYIGKGPKGYFELLMLIADIARKLQLDGTIKNRFGNIPIIIHDFEYPWYVKEATMLANPNNEAADFLASYSEWAE